MPYLLPAALSTERLWREIGFVLAFWGLFSSIFTLRCYGTYEKVVSSKSILIHWLNI